MTSPFKRRWFRFSFSLKTLFVAMTVFAVWLGWNLSIVRERRSIINEMDTNYTGFVAWYVCLEDEATVRDPGWFDRVNGRFIQISAIRRLLGDKSILDIYLSESVDLEFVGRIECAFPEAYLSVSDSETTFEKASRDSLSLPLADRRPNTGTTFKTGLIEK